MSDRTQSTYAKGREAEDSTKAVAAVFDAQADRYQKLLPSHIKLDDFRNAFLTSVQRNTRLLEADRSSFWLALQQAAGDGLKCDGREAALVIFADDDDEDKPKRAGKPKQVVYMPMVAGLRKLLRNTGQVATIETDLIFQGETIAIWREDGHRHFKHTVNTDPSADRSDRSVIGAYAVVTFKDGTWQAEWMNRAEIEKVRAVSRAKSARAPWQTWYGEMARKTVLRRLAKQLDRSPEVEALQDALERDPAIGDTIDGEATEIAHAIAAPPTPSPRGRGEPTPKGREVHVEDDPDAFRREVANPPPAAPPPGARQESPPPAHDPAPPTPEAAGTPFQPPHEDGGFAAWLVDQYGREVREEPFTDARVFAEALAALCEFNPTMVEEIFEANLGAIGDASDADLSAQEIINAIRTKPELPADPAPEPPPPAWQVSILPMITMPGKPTPHWPNYVAAAQKALDECPTPEAVEAWLAANLPTFENKSIQAETRIKRHATAVFARLSGHPAETPADAARKKADNILAGLQDCPDKAAAMRFKESMRPAINGLRQDGFEAEAERVIRTIDAWQPPG